VLVLGDVDLQRAHCDGDKKKASGVPKIRLKTTYSRHQRMQDRLNLALVGTL